MNPLDNLKKLHEELMFKENYDKGINELNSNRKLISEYKKEKDIRKFLKKRKQK